MQFGTNVAKNVLFHIRARAILDLDWFLSYSRWRPKMAAKYQFFANNSKGGPVRAKSCIISQWEYGHCAHFEPICMLLA